MGTNLSTLIHGAGAATFGLAAYYQFFRLRVPPHLMKYIRLRALDNKLGKLWYLTNWDLLLQLAYFGISLANDIIGTNELDPMKQAMMQKIRDSLFASVAFPVGSFVTITFWALWAIDRGLVFSKELDEFYPSWLHHVAHTAPLFFLLADFFCVPKVFPKRCAAVMGNIAFATAYFGMVALIAIKTGKWNYPVLVKLGRVSRAIMLLSWGASIVGLYFLGEKFQKLRWGEGAFAGLKDAAGIVKRA